MRFLKLPILVSVLFFGTAFGQETPKPLPEEIAIYTSANIPNFPDGGINRFRQLVPPAHWPICVLSLLLPTPPTLSLSLFLNRLFIYP